MEVLKLMNKEDIKTLPQIKFDAEFDHCWSVYDFAIVKLTDGKFYFAFQTEYVCEGYEKCTTIKNEESFIRSDFRQPFIKLQKLTEIDNWIKLSFISYIKEKSEANLNYRYPFSSSDSKNLIQFDKIWTFN